MNWLRGPINFFQQNIHWQYLILVAVSLGWFGFLQFSPTLADPDAFYHAKMPLIIVEQGAITSFPWLSATTLAYSYTNHHFLFHLLLIPFVWFSPLIGLKVATVILAVGSVIIFFWLLRKLNVIGAWWYVLLLLASNPFVFRLSLGKAQGLSLILLFLIIYGIVHRKYLALIILACFYVWAYAGWPVALVMAVIYSVVSVAWFVVKSPNIVKKINHLKLLSQAYLIFISLIIGVACGLFFSPYFPGNLGFYWQQTFHIALLNYQHLIGVGGEWYPILISEWFLLSPFFMVLNVAALSAFVITAKRQPIQSWFLLIVSFLFFILTIKSRRYIEYAVPLVLIFDSVCFSVVWQILKKEQPKLIAKKIVKIGLAVVMVAGLAVSVYEVRNVNASLKQGFAFEAFAEASSWLKNNSNQGEIVFHSDWDIFPILFYNNHWNYYIVGLDPTFMYINDPDLHDRFVKITSGQPDIDYYQTIGYLFNASFVLIDINRHQDFDKVLLEDPRFELVYEDNRAKVYQLIK